MLGESNVIRIKLNDLLSFIALFVAFFCATNGELRYTENTLIYYLPFLLCFAALIMELLVRRIVISNYLIWRVLLLLFFVVTLAYVQDFDVSFVAIKTFILQSFVVLLIALKCSDDPTNIKKIMVVGLLASFCTMLYIFSAVDVSAIEAQERLGTSTFGDVWNANNIGSMASYSMLISFAVVFVFKKKPTPLGKVVCVLLMIAFGYLMIMSGSRKSILIVLVTVLLYIMNGQKSKRVRNTLLAVILSLLAVYAIYNVPFLYNHVGYRFEGMLEAVMGQGGDKSAQMRQNMVEKGIEYFLDKPFLGHGVNGFAVLYHQTYGVRAYSHNNFIEMLVTGGVVGFVLYYIYIARMLTKKCEPTRQIAFAKAMVIAMLVGDMGCVSYNDPYIQYILCLIAYSIYYSGSLAKLYGGKMDDNKKKLQSKKAETTPQAGGQECSEN